MIRPAAAEDLRPIAALHRRAFRGFFLTQLGRPFLLRYYRAVLAYPSGILVVAEDARAIAGFVAGFREPGGFYRSLRRRAVSLALAMLPALLRDPRMLQRAVANFRRTGEPGAPDDSDTAELSSLAVEPSAGGKGLGKVLVEEFVRVAAASGAKSVYLTTDAMDNDAVNAFYVRLGFRVRRTFDASPGRLMNEFRLEIGQREAGCDVSS